MAAMNQQHDTFKHTTRICLIRHGETGWNASKRIQGQLDVELNEKGVTQAQVLAGAARDCEFAAIYSSDLMRAAETARHLAAGRALQVVTMTDLRERHFGDFQGLLNSEVQARWPDEFERYRSGDAQFDFFSGEALLPFRQRILAVFEALAAKHRGRQIAVVTHAGVLDVMYRQATARSIEAPRDFPIPNAVLNQFTRDARGWRVTHWGGVAVGNALDAVE